MSKCLFAGAFMSAVLISGCAQTPSSHSHASSKTEMHHALDAKEITGSKSQEEIIDEVMYESGLDEMIEQMPTLISSMNANQPPPPMVKTEEYEKFKENIVQVFEPVKTRKVFRSYLEEHYDAKRFPEFLALLKTPLAQEMTALELAASTPESHQEMMQTGDALMREASPRRLDLIRQFDEVTGSTEIMVDMQMIMAGMVQRNMNKIMPREHRMTEAQLDQMLEQGRISSMLPARQFMQLNMVYTYRTLDDRKLKDYIDLHQSEIGLWGTELAKNSMLKWAESASAEMAELMEKMFVETHSG